jgi:hypothetical protein
MTTQSRALLISALLLSLSGPIALLAADTHYAFNRNLSAGFRLGRAHEALEHAREYLVAEEATMRAMINGDGSADVHYAALTAAYGFASDADAHQAYLEVFGVATKITTDASQTNVAAAITQMLARLRS